MRHVLAVPARFSATTVTRPLAAPVTKASLIKHLVLLDSHAPPTKRRCCINTDEAPHCLRTVYLPGTHVNMLRCDMLTVRPLHSVYIFVIVRSLRVVTTTG